MAFASDGLSASDLFFHVVVAFKEFYGHVAWREMLPDGRCGFHHVDNLPDSAFEVGAEVDVDVADDVVLAFVYGDYGIEKFLQSFSGFGNNRYHRDAYHFAEVLVVEGGALRP